MASKGKENEELFSVPAVERPTIEQLQMIAERIHLNLSHDELVQYKGIYSSFSLNVLKSEPIYLDWCSNYL
jgi:hypothetical protein